MYPGPEILYNLAVRESMVKRDILKHPELLSTKHQTFPNFCFGYVWGTVRKASVIAFYVSKRSRNIVLHHRKMGIFSELHKLVKSIL